MEVEEVEVDAIPDDERSGIQEYLTEWGEPSVRQSRDQSFDDVSNRKISRVLLNVVNESGPEKRERVFRAVISRWQISRLGKNIRRSIGGIVSSLSQKNSVHLDDGFIWPGERPDTIEVRTNTDTASRSADEIPLEELARAGHLVLEAGTHMTREDLVLEIARLYNYQRTGSNIKDRINDAIDVLASEGCARIDERNDRIEFVDTNADKRLLDRVYK